MASVRFTDVQARPTEFLDLTGLTLDDNWLRVFRRAVLVLLCAGGGPERETSPVPSEKGAVQCSSQDDAMRRLPARCAQGIARCSGLLGMPFLIVFQWVGTIDKTCNHLR